MMPQKEKVWLLQATWLCLMASKRSPRVDGPCYMLDPK